MNIIKKLTLGLHLRKMWNWASDQPWKEGLAVPEMATVPVKSVAKSKIAWGAGIMLLFGLLQFFGLNITGEQQDAIKTTVQQIIDGVVQVILPFLILVWRTFFNKSTTGPAV